MAGLFATILGSTQHGDSKKTTTPWSPDDDRWYEKDAGGKLGPAGRRVTPDIAMQFSAYYAAVHLLATTIAALPLRMYSKDREGNATESPNHPLNDVLEFQPNRWQTAFEFKSWMMLSVIQRGNALAEIIPGARGAVDQLEPIHWDRVSSVTKGDDGIIRYGVDSFLKGGKRRILLQDEVLHLRGPNAPGLVGIAPIAYARNTVGLALATEDHGSRTFNSGARPSGVVTVDKTMSEPAFERFKNDWRANFDGPANAGKTPILEDGASFKPITMTNEDTQFLATRQHQIEEICRWLNVPPVMIHHMTKTTSWGSGVEAIMLSFVRTSILPYTTLWTQAIRRDLIVAPRFYEAQFDIESLIRGDSKAQADFFSRLVLNGILTRNEARAALGYNPLDGLSDPLVPSNTNNSDAQPGNGGGAPDKEQAMIGHNGDPALTDLDQDEVTTETTEGTDE